VRRVIVESPYAGDVARNVEYARACVRDSLQRGEAPYRKLGGAWARLGSALIREGFNL